jgi:hypothetical protein
MENIYSNGLPPRTYGGVNTESKSSREKENNDGDQKVNPF